MAVSDADLIAAALAGGMIAASGKPHTITAALALFRRVREAVIEERAASEPERPAAA